MPRLRWDEVPTHVRGAIVRELGVEVVAATSVESGFSPGLAAALTLADDRRVFVKAVSSGQNPESPDLLRREVDVVLALPPDLPVPGLIAALDDGEWIAAIFEHVDGRPPTLPWDTAELQRAVHALTALNASPAPAGLPTAAERLAPLFDGWAAMRDREALPDAWEGRTDLLIGLERESLDAMAGDRLVHADVRADNMLVTPKGDVVLVDWAHTCRGAPWIDLVLWLPALELEGGPDPETVLAVAPTSLRPPPDSLVRVVAACAGYFASRGGLPDPPGLPTVRAFQRAQAERALAWLERLLSGADPA